MQADYSKDTESTYDVDHRDNLFNYGYIGKFTPVRELVENTPLEWQGEDNTIDIIGLDENGVPTPGDTLFDVLTSDGAGGTLFGLTQNLISYYDFEARHFIIIIGVLACNQILTCYLILL